MMLACMLMAGVALAGGHWVGPWGTAPQLVERHNNPPAPGLTNNSLREIVQVSIGGKKVRLKLTNEFSTEATEIKAVELAIAKTAGSSSEIDEATTVSLTFNGESGVTIPANGTVISDAVNFKMDDRQNVAITIHYGSASPSVSGHPGSRTTSYLKEGNTTDFTGAIRTDHRVGVLNMGIGGNCVLGGGLGPAAVNRYQRDLFGQEGVKWIILFEAVNDLGYARNGVQTAERIIEVYKKIIDEAHQKGIRVFGATITPFKGNNYYSEDHEKGRSTINTWIRTTDLLDGVIDFDQAVRNPQDPEAMQAQFLFENDWLHLNAKGYETMGNSIDLNLFK